MGDREQVEALARRLADARCEAFPAQATALGRHDRDHELGDYGTATFETHARRVGALRRELAPFLDAADAATRLDAVALDGVLATELLDLEVEQSWRRNPERAVAAALDSSFALLLRDFAPLPERLQALAGRLGALPAHLDGARRTWRDVPRVWADSAAELASFGAAFLRRDLAGALGDAPGRDAVLDAADGAAAALTACAADLEALGSDAPWRAGEEVFAAHLRHEHRLGDSPAALEARGLALVAETEAALAATGAGWRDALERLRDDHPPAVELVDVYRAEMRRVRDFVLERGLVPGNDAPLEVRETPPFWVHLLPYAAYDHPGYFEEDQRGIFWVTVPEQADLLRAHSRASITCTCAHEGFPGHHHQLTHANRQAGLIGALADSALTIEGWAFYCDEMVADAGLDAGAAALRLGQLNDQLWRAARVVIDVRLHTGEMTVDEAVDYLVRVAALERPHAVAEVRRYTSTPTYQISYAIGKAEIRALADRVRAREGPAFDLGRFHERFLDHGSVPVPLVAAAMLGEDPPARSA